MRLALSQHGGYRTIPALLSLGASAIRIFGIVRENSFDDAPLELRVEVVEALGTNPVVVVLGAVALVQNIWVIVDHELGPAEVAVVMVPVWVLGVAAVGAMHESNAPEIPLLSLESPIGIPTHYALFTGCE